MSFKDEFEKEIENPDIGRIFTRYITGMNNYLEFMFVEGESDIKYYSTMYNHNLTDIDYIKCGAKPNVCGIYKYLDKHSEVKNEKNDYYFIVDKDYDGLSKIKNLSPNHNISMTKYHSYESYAFTENNIDVILKENGLVDEEIKEFKSIFKDFFNKIKKYERYKALDIELPKLDGYLSFNKETNLLDIDKNLLEKVDKVALSKSKNKLYNEKKVIINSLKEIRGHNVEMAFEIIFKEKFNKDIKLLDILSNSEIVSKLDIDFKLK